MDGLVYRSAKQSDADPYAYVLSDETVDRYGEVIEAAGWDLTEFKADRNPIALFNHNRDAIIGRWEDVRVNNRQQLVGRLVLAEKGTSAVVDEVREHWRQGNLRAVSVGFQPLAKKPMNDKADDYFGPFRYTRQQLVECSLVSVPANPNALQISRAFELPTDVRRQLFGKPAVQEQRAAPVVPRKPAPLLASASIPMKLSEKITTAQASINAMRDALTALNEKDIATPDEQTQADDLAERIPQAVAELEKLQLRERALSIVVERGIEPPVSRDQPQRPFAAAAKKIVPSDYLVRTAVVNLLAHVSHKSYDQILAERYPDEITGTVVRAVVNPATTVFPTWAAELVETAVADFLQLLMPLSLYQPLSARGGRFTFDRAGVIKIPSRTSTPNIAGAFIGEGAPIPVKRAGLTSISLTPKKLGVISTFTRELAQHSTPSIEKVIRDAMAEDTAAAVDALLIDTQAATTIRPAGLRNGVSGTTPSAAAPNIAMVADLKALLGVITSANGGRDVVVMINPAQGLALSFLQTTTGDFMFAGPNEAGQRLGVTFIQSTTVPAGMVIAVDAADFVSAAGDTPEFDVSDQATIHEEDTAPLPIVGGTAQPPLIGSVAAPVRSLWQTASLGVRMLLDMNWAMRRTGMVAWMSPVVW